MSEYLLDIKNLSVEYTADGDVVQAVNGMELQLRHGESLGLVGETGAGKTTTALAVLGLLPDRTSHIPRGSIRFDGEDVLAIRDRGGNALSEEECIAAHTPEGGDPAEVKLPAPKYMADKKMRAIRGNRISMIFQDPMTSLNPVHSVGDQIAEVVYLHGGHSRQEAREQACRMLEMVGIPAERYHEYPHQFSGGMKQRVVIAMSIACSPQLILADEPTTALDVTIQAQVLELMNELKREIKTSVLLITHDLGVVAQVCDRVAIMYCGQIVEQGTIEEVFTHPSPPLHHRPFWLHPHAGCHIQPPDAHRGHGGRPHRSAGGLLLCAPLPLCHRAVPGAAPRARQYGRQPPGALFCGAGRVPLRNTQGGDPRWPGMRTFWRYVTLKSTLRRAAVCSTPWMTSISPSSAARRWVWWASPAAARAPSAG